MLVNEAIAIAAKAAADAGCMNAVADLGLGNGGAVQKRDRLFKGEVPLDNEQLCDIERMRIEYPFVAIGETVIMDSLLSEPLAVQRNGKRIPLSELSIDRQSVIKYDMPQVSRAALSYIHTMGVVPLAVRRVENRAVVPYVPSYKLGRITTYVSENVQHFRWWWDTRIAGTDGRRNKPTGGAAAGGLVADATANTAFGSVGGGVYAYDPTVIVLSGFDRAPNPDGTLESKLMTVLESVRAARRLNRFDETAARMRSDPVIFYEKRDPFGGTGNNATGGGAFGMLDSRNMYSDTDATDEMSRQRIATNRDQLIELQQFYKSADETYRAFETQLNTVFTGGNSKQKTLQDKREVLETIGAKRRRAIEKLVPLVPGATIASNVPVAQVSSQQLERDQAINVTILLTLGVPPDIVQTMSTHRAGVEVVSSNFRVTTLRRWQGWLERILTVAYLHTYGDEDVTRVVNEVVSLKTTAAAAPPSSSIDDMCRKNCVSIGFVIEERTTSEDLTMLLKLGFMTPAQFIEHFRRIKHMPASDDAETLDVAKIERRIQAEMEVEVAAPTNVKK